MNRRQRERFEAGLCIFCGDVPATEPTWNGGPPRSCRECEDGRREDAEQARAESIREMRMLEGYER